MKRAINWILNRRTIKPVVVYCMTDEQKEKYYILELRSSMQFLGYDVRDMTDEEIKEGFNKMGKLLSSTCVTAEQASKAMKLMNN